ncbi:DUF2637 domain-containing protein [Streptomyces sp. NPDC004230]
MVVAGAVIIAGIGFAGSYAAVRELALQKGFGNFAYVFPIGIDAGICVLLSLDLLLTWIRIPFPLLRQTAWLLTAATIAFNGAAAWPDPLGVGMHAVIPVLFIVAVEAARHAIGRIADITADKHMEGVRLTRWLLSPAPTFLLWRRMKLWELRSYDQVIRLEQERLVYQARLRSRFGRAWRRKAPVESLMPLRLAKYGVPLMNTAPAGLAAAGISEPMPVLTRPLPSDEPTPLETASDEHQRALEALEPSDQAADHQAEDSSAQPIRQPADAQPEPGNALPVDEPVWNLTADAHPSFPVAFAEYLNHYGDFPTARQFALVLADGYGLTDSSHGGPIAEKALIPVVRELRRRAEVPGEWTADPSVTDFPQSGMTDPAGHGVSVVGRPAFDASSFMPSTALRMTGADPVPAPTASASDLPGTEEQLPQRTAFDLSSGSVGSSVGTDAGRPWEATVRDTGEATARLPEQQSAETSVADLTEDQRVQLVVGWLREAEAQGVKFSGAEAARRNQVSPKTGQRDVIKAREILEAERRDRGRAHLRSVRND